MQTRLNIISKILNLLWHPQPSQLQFPNALHFLVVSSGLFMTLLSLCGTSTSCPSGCSCNVNHTDCSDLNQLESLDSILEQLPFDTSYLNLSNNNFTTVEPGSFSNFSGLLYLDLSRNLLSSINAGCFSNLSRLLHLDLSRNLLSSVFSSSFSHLNNLEVLDLSENLLVRLPVNLFSDLGSLTELALRDNRLKELNPDQFKGLTEIRRLDLSLNSLSSVPTHLLDGLQNLVWLSLMGNRLRTLQQTSLEPATALQHLLLEGNPWNCNCNLIPLKHWLEWIIYTGGNVDSANCSFPANLHGKDLRSIPMEMFRHCYPRYLETRSPSAAEGHQVPAGSAGDCMRQRYRSVSVRRATATVVVAGVVCGVVCVMMVVTATYGCIYAILMAHEQQQLTERNSQQQQPLMVAKEPEQDEKEDLMPTIGKGAEATECVGWMAFPPEVCV
ncbi:leucine-rich repeat and transmembrane domain-containing protein 2-like isoform X1 [Sinocyclocheilus anshuiensis]|uniref:leucine-rich repeat and transmembrane domain-containing protein 2-like isoform X1 n=1 Tax=Sinocyclocheilus anshuiensis TaxID=1608454 RepID=UPI0007B7C7EF|nr:PREDICTED: leucine-rich repeat and transmembrane domain-containing protein 2-like isoform X1 [Sinocyclocheilus anshuiensis]